MKLFLALLVFHVTAEPCIDIQGHCPSFPLVDSQVTVFESPVLSTLKWNTRQEILDEWPVLLNDLLVSLLMIAF